MGSLFLRIVHVAMDTLEYGKNLALHRTHLPLLPTYRIRNNRIVTKVIRGKLRYFLQMVLEGLRHPGVMQILLVLYCPRLRRGLFDLQRRLPCPCGAPTPMKKGAHRGEDFGSMEMTFDRDRYFSDAMSS